MLKFFIKIILISFMFLIHVNAEPVKKITILGNERVSKDTIILFSEIVLDENLSNNDLNNIVKKLYKTSFFKDVKVSFINTNLTITVVENPIIQNLKIDGVKSKELKKLIIQKIDLKNSSSFNEFYVKKDLKVIENILQNLGYYFSKTETLISDNNNKTIDLTFLIDLGEKSYISEIIFLGDKKFKSGNIQNIIASEVNKFWKVISKKKFLNKERIELDKRLLRNFYKNKGFYNVKIEGNTVDY